MPSASTVRAEIAPLVMRAPLVSLLLVTLAIVTLVIASSSAHAARAIAPALASEPPQSQVEPALVPALAKPSAEQLAWQDLELGMFVHLAPQTWQDKEEDDLSTEPGAMDPEKLDTDQWVRVAESMHAKYIVFVAKHEGGFCWWPTETTDFCVRHSPWRGGKGDVLRDLSSSCKARGMKLGVYLSPQDKKHAIGIGGKAKTPEEQAKYEKLFRQQLTEVLSRYGTMCEVWFDGSLVFDVGDILSKHAQHAMVFQGPQATIRWVGNEDGIAPETNWNAVKFGQKKWGDYTSEDGDAGGDRWLPNECDARLRSTWFWNTKGEKTIKSVEQLMDMYCKSVGRGAVLLLNNTPDRSGLIPEPDAKRAAEFGAELDRMFSHPAAEVIGNMPWVNPRTLALNVPMKIDRALTLEDIGAGQRVRRYVIEGRVGGGEWKELAAGTSIGHEKIDRFAPLEVSEVRLRCVESAGEPMLRRFAVYRASP
jgi:alpha-L-fucosidase